MGKAAPAGAKIFEKAFIQLKSPRVSEAHGSESAVVQAFKPQRTSNYATGTVPLYFR